MAATFTWIPSTGFGKSNVARVSTAQFGDGYSQRTSEGLNTINSTWNLTFINQPTATAEAIDVFLSTAGTGDYTESGKSYFLWNPPGDSNTYKVICSEWGIEYTSHISATVTAKFIRVYEQ